MDLFLHCILRYQYHFKSNFIGNFKVWKDMKNILHLTRLPQDILMNYSIISLNYSVNILEERKQSK